MQQLNIYEAKTNFSQLVEQASQGNTIIIAKSGKPLAKLVPLSSGEAKPFQFGSLLGAIKTSDDFDAPLSADVLDLFEAD